MIQRTSNPTLLYVDDEEIAVRLFQRIFKNDYTVLSAASVDEAEAILRERASEISVVISDQRMPSKNGVELLDHIRERHPQIMRILTTGYSEISDAIDAVNKGEIFRYINKPWNVENLKHEVILAVKFYQIQRERNMLLHAKLSATKRQLVTDRVRSLVAFGASLPFVDRAGAGMLNYLNDMSSGEVAISVAGLELHQQDFWTLPIDETMRLSKAFSDISRTLFQRSDNSSESATIPDLIDSLVGKQCTAQEIDHETLLPKLFTSTEHHAELRSLFSWIHAATGAGHVVYSNIGDHLQLHFKGTVGPLDSTGVLYGMTEKSVSVVDIQLLQAYLLASQLSIDCALDADQTGIMLIWPTPTGSPYARPDAAPSFETILMRYE
ncbi:MAG: response regulator [Kordiimonadaceae bacterium]|nr:response regulator [Kordiimonadaceae bacterium]